MHFSTFDCCQNFNAHAINIEKVVCFLKVIEGSNSQTIDKSGSFFNADYYSVTMRHWSGLGT
jgi:hypothetical protein